MNTLNLILLRLSGARYWSSLDMPMSAWIEVNEKGDLKLMRKRGWFSLQKALECRQIIFDKIVDTFGISSHAKMIIRKKLQIEKDWIKVLTNGERHLITYIEIAEKELELLQSSKKDITFIESIVSLKAVLRYDINPKKITIEEYLATVKMIEKNGRKKDSSE